MRTWLVVLALALVAVGCRKSHGPRGDVQLSPVQVVADGPGNGHAHLEFTLLKPPPGDSGKLYVQVGADMFEGIVRTIEWPELLERNSSGSTTPTSKPAVGMRFVLDVPVKLKQQVKSSKHFGANFDVITNVFWGTNDEGPIQQARDEATLEHLYKHTL
jgi:hypothetical protein